MPHVLELVQNIFLIGYNMLEIQYSTGPQDLLALAQYNPPSFKKHLFEHLICWCKIFVFLQNHCSMVVK